VSLGVTNGKLWVPKAQRWVGLISTRLTGGHQRLVTSGVSALVLYWDIQEATCLMNIP